MENGALFIAGFGASSELMGEKPALGPRFFNHRIRAGAEQPRRRFNRLAHRGAPPARAFGGVALGARARACARG
jgi:hypothetical protein